MKDYYSEDVTNQEVDADGDFSVPDMDEFCGYPFAMEITNGEIISLTKDVQRKIREEIRKKLRVNDGELTELLAELAAAGTIDLEYDVNEDVKDALEECGYDALVEILGFDEEEEKFKPQGIDFLESEYGFEAKDLMATLGFDLHDDTLENPHGHGGCGVVYLE